MFGICKTAPTAVGSVLQHEHNQYTKSQISGHSIVIQQSLASLIFDSIVISDAKPILHVRDEINCVRREGPVTLNLKISISRIQLPFLRSKKQPDRINRPAYRRKCNQRGFLLPDSACRNGADKIPVLYKYLRYHY
jgi:hypothetical protein